MLNHEHDRYHRRNLFWLSLSTMILFLDQISKALALKYLTQPGSIEINSVFNLTLVFNRGAAFSFLSQASGWQHILFGSISLSVCAYIIYLLPRIEPQAKLNLTALSLIVGGAIGNLWDRISYGYVIDFLHLHLWDWHFPVFNIADSAITLGCGLLILSVLTEK